MIMIKTFIKNMDLLVALSATKHLQTLMNLQSIKRNIL
ncbi:uncharacterized protein METZ01_LOCUS12392 [marine metagenome]|uniref:Uncharacterized protein n=1 Tax=marine metagenome TaxID=408172 RepID=A0A381P058_9ZZZZ